MGVIGRAEVRVNWRVWAVLVCLQVGVVCAEVTESLQDIQQEGNGRNGVGDEVDSELEARGKKKDKKKMKYVVAVLIGVIIVKGVLIPLALKAVSFVAGKAFLLSALSLILSAILGFRQMASHGWDRMGQMMMMKDRGEITEAIPYHPIPTEAMYHKVSSDQYWARNMETK